MTGPRALLVKAAAICLCAAAPSAGAVETLRCGASLIEPGITAAEVRAECGKPDAKDVEHVPVRARTVHGASITIGVTTVERWTYERGGRIPARLTFEDDRLKRIELLTGS